jgi:hypothetical protein
MHVYGSARCYTDHILKSLVALTLSTTSHICVYMYIHVDIHEGDNSLMAVEVRCQVCKYVLYPTALPTGETAHHILYVKFESEVRVRLTTAIVDEHNRCNTVSHVRKHANHWSLRASCRLSSTILTGHSSQPVKFSVSSNTPWPLVQSFVTYFASKAMQEARTQQDTAAANLSANPPFRSSRSPTAQKSHLQQVAYHGV